MSDRLRPVCPGCGAEGRIREVAKTYAYYLLAGVDRGGATERGPIELERTLFSDEEEVFWHCDECGIEIDAIEEILAAARGSNEGGS